MELIIISLFLFGILNTNAIFVTNNSTLMIKERNELSSERTPEYITEEKAGSLGEFCLTDEQCWTPNSYCGYNGFSIYKMCKCKSDYVKLNDKCSRKVTLDKICFTDEQCWTPNSYCGYNSYSSYRTCKCKSDYVKLIGNCSRKAFLDEPCLSDEQCQTPNSNCIFSMFSSYKSCKCESNYVKSYDSCLIKVSLGGFCTITQQCLDSNSFCGYVCRCEFGYYERNGKCVRQDVRRDNRLDDGIIALFSIFAVIVIVIIILSIISYTRRRSRTQSRTQINEVIPAHIPPPYTVQLPPNINGLQSQATGSSIHDFDKPPSYEDVVRS